MSLYCLTNGDLRRLREWRLKSQNNVFVFCAKRYQLIYNFSISIVGLNPNFIANKVEMKNDIMDEVFLLIPPNADQLIMMTFFVCDNLVVDVRPERRLYSSIFF